MRLSTKNLMVIISVAMILLMQTYESKSKHEKTILPEYPETQSSLYSGYLGTSHSDMHYLLVDGLSKESPLVLWLNIGCSSLLDFVNHNGPAEIDSLSNKFKKNDFAWNKLAYMLYIDLPGVGFSTLNHKQATEKIYLDSVKEGLLVFFKKFPNLSSKRLFIGGEGLSGTFIPNLSNEIILYNKSAVDKINLKGIMIGNGVIDLSKRSSYFIHYAFYHGFYSIENKDKLSDACGHTFPYNYENTNCKQAFNEAYNQIGDINLINIYKDCLQNSSSNKFNKSGHANNFVYQVLEGSYTDSDLDYTGCDETGDAYAYFNNPLVKKALHVNESSKWTECSVNSIQVNEEKTTSFYMNLIHENIQIMLYSGNLDAVVPFNQLRDWLIKLKIELLNPSFKAWALPNSEINGGSVTFYKNLTYYLVHGFGHYSSSKKAEIQFIFSHFLDHIS